MSETRDNVVLAGLFQQLELLKVCMLLKMAQSRLSPSNNSWTVLEDHMKTKVAMEDKWMLPFGT